MIIWKLRGTNSENRKSNAIEGNMLTLRETDMVLRGLTIGQKSLKDHMEAACKSGADESRLSAG